MGYGAMNTDLILIVTTPGTGALSSAPAKTYTPVYAEKRSVTRAEFYSAMTAGAKVDVMFVVNPDDYAYQDEVNEGGTLSGTTLTGGTTYRVVRSFTPPRGYTELYCARR